eukprot:TRINITY_DN47134_c0_g1_i1.p1 TRINITY_DN47134_c0_g1~~TRINITY_DN47134_c0_g1_i1.p1  ORF type:complete len:281 (-),score=36.71 TRINITY_DN47134_c0_g1_i1:218-934(-)
MDDAWQNTVLLLTSDHGWHLGEQNEWCKTTLFENALHVPFMIRDPRTFAPHGHSGEWTTAFAENVDIYRTLADLAGLADRVESTVQGTSLAPLLRNLQDASAKHAAFSQMARCVTDAITGKEIDIWTTADSCTRTPKDKIGYMGYSVRVSTWRFTMWLEWDGLQLAANWNKVNATELYDHHGDHGTGPTMFDEYEHENVATSHPDVVAKLTALLRERFAPITQIGEQNVQANAQHVLV